MVRAIMPSRSRQARHSHNRPRCRDSSQRSQAVVADTLVPRPWVGEAHPQSRHRPPSQPVDPIDDLALFDRGESPAGPGTHPSRPHRSHHEIRLERGSGCQQPGILIHRLVIAPKGVSRGNRTRQPAPSPQLVHQPAEGQGQRSAVGHQVGDPGRALQGRSQADLVASMPGGEPHAARVPSPAAGRPG